MVPFVGLAFGVALSFCIVSLGVGSEFRTHELPEGVTIQIPAHWRVLTKDMRKNIRAATEAMAEQANLPLRKAINVLHVNAAPDPPGAIVRVTIGPPPPFAAADLKDVTENDLLELKKTYDSQMRALQKHGGPEIVESYLPRVELVSGIPAVAWSYRRKGAIGASTWYVTQYKVPARSMLVELTISYRESDSGIWKPVLTKVRQSIAIPG